MLYWWKKWQGDQWNGIESPQTDPHEYSQLIFDQETKAIKWRKDSFSTNGAGTIRHQHAKKKKESRHTPHIIQKMESKWITDLNVNAKL